MTPAEEEALQFAEALRGLAIDIVGAAEIQTTGKEAIRNPKVVALTLLCRSITNFKGAMIMAREGMIVEARTLVRMCFENLLWVGALHAQGATFVDEMLSDGAANHKTLGELALKMGSPEAKNNEDGQLIRAELRKLSSRFPKPERFKASQVAGKSVAQKAYIPYFRLSLDAVHPSLTALKRHLRFEQETDGLCLTAFVEPPLKPGENLATIDEACNALLGVCVAVNEMLGGTAKSDALSVLFERFERQGLHAYSAHSAS